MNVIWIQRLSNKVNVGFFYKYFKIKKMSKKVDTVELVIAF
jgi:hypothetical protein